MDQSVEMQLRILRLLKKMRVMKVEDYSKTRIGAPFDGGYVMLDDFRSIDAAYSFGISGDVSWDKDIADRGIKTFQYDHTIDRLPEEHDNFEWSKVGLGSRDVSAEQIASLDTLISMNGHINSNDLLMKIDIEDAEWDVFANADLQTLAKFSQIVGEFHWFQLLEDPLRYAKTLEALDRLSFTHRLIHVHANNFGAWSFIGNVPLPAVLELSFVRANGKTFRVSEETFPTSLDAPNNPNLADYKLGRFLFD